MKHKKIILILVIILLTGCKVNSNIEIDYNYNVKEKIDIIFSNSLAVNNSSPKRYAEDFLEYYKPVIDFKKYNFEITEEKDESYVTFSKDSKNICDNLNYNMFLPYLYKSIDCFEDDSYIILKSKGEQLISKPLSEKKFNVEEVSINIKFPIPLEENNADKVKDNTYTWNYDLNTDASKEIYLKLDKNKIIEKQQEVVKKEKTSNVLNKVGIVSLIVVIIIIISFISYTLYKKYKSNQLDY